MFKQRFIFHCQGMSNCCTIICYKGYPLSCSYNFVKSQLSTFMWAHFWVLYFVLLVYVFITEKVSFRDLI